MIEHHRAYFQAVSHAHCVAIAQQPRFQVCGEIDKSDSLHYVIALICRAHSRIQSAASKRRRRSEARIQKLAHVGFQKLHAYGQLRRNKWVIGTERDMKFAPAEWERFVV